MHLARITIFAGHFGSGKTSLAVAYALWASKQKDRVILCDLDIVNPYFRTADAAEALKGAGIRLVASRFANTNVDAPAMPSETRALFDDPDTTGIIDLGGDDRGALALGRYAGLLQSRGGYEMLLVINQYRPLTRNLDDLCQIKEEIETASKVGFTGLVNNSNLAAETTLSDVLATAEFAAGVAARLGLPLKMTALERCLVQGEGVRRKAQLTLGEIFPLDLYKKQGWKL
ncbi:MAG: hypothetical protein FWH51_05210 [Dehalococcoidia bacterium]|nr:hypothetical protein [Dehalococcoidia bacterium]